jgi:predicted transcriptional regulator of viral defense system
VTDGDDLTWHLHLGNQAKVTSRRQALDAGWSPKAIEWRLHSGRWLRLRRGAYATFTGDTPRKARLWAAVLRAGPGAVLSHETAAEVHGFADEASRKIHISVPVARNPARLRPIHGVVIHRARNLTPD